MNEDDRKIGFIGFGEAAYVLSKGLINEGSDSIFAYDILWKTDPECERSKKIKQLAIEIGVKPVYSYENLSSNAQIIISAVTPSAALSVARQAARFIDKNKIYADINSKSPRATIDIWNVIRLSKAKFVDVAVMGSITKYGYKVPCLASGNGSKQFSKLNKYGMNIKFIGQEPGQASAIKMLRSIYTKGVAAALYALHSLYGFGCQNPCSSSKGTVNSSIMFHCVSGLLAHASFPHHNPNLEILDEFIFEQVHARTCGWTSTHHPPSAILLFH